MAKCKKCRSYRSSMSMQFDNCPDCLDVCTKAPCGDPKYLTTLAPVIFDQIGINLCTTITLTPDVSEQYPTAVKATARVINITFPTTGTAGEYVTVEPIPSRPNCYTVTLTNLTVNFAIMLYDCANRLLATIPVSQMYLPSATSTPGYDEDTNPSSAVLEIYAPYGISYVGTGTALTTPEIPFIGFASSGTNMMQGINMTAMAKILDFDTIANTVTIGLSVYLHSIYYIAYKLEHKGKAQVPKASLASDDDTLCMAFVEGDLLNMNIKPLELGPPKCEQQNKTPCRDDFSTSDCKTSKDCP